MKMIDKSYNELISIKSFKERVDYLKLNGNVGIITFGSHRYLNQVLYKDPYWKQTRQKVILRDYGYDLAHEDHPIIGYIYIHHINPITIDDVLSRNHKIFDLNNLISTSFKTHQFVHYCDGEIDEIGYAIRKENDTCLWR